MNVVTFFLRRSVQVVPVTYLYKVEGYLYFLINLRNILSLVSNYSGACKLANCDSFLTKHCYALLDIGFISKQKFFFGSFVTYISQFV